MEVLRAQAPAVLTARYSRGITAAQVIRTGEWLLLLAVCAFGCGRVLPRAWRHLNTDFPNYYIRARLLRECYSTHRLYEWVWFQRQKDRVGITRGDQPVVGFLPDTPFSA